MLQRCEEERYAARMAIRAVRSKIEKLIELLKRPDVSRSMETTKLSADLKRMAAECTARLSSVDGDPRG